MNEMIFWLYWSKYFSQFDPWVLSPFELLTRDWTIFERPTRAFWLATDNSNSEYYFLYFYCRKKKNYFEKKRIFFFFFTFGNEIIFDWVYQAWQHHPQEKDGGDCNIWIGHVHQIFVGIRFIDDVGEILQQVDQFPV